MAWVYYADKKNVYKNSAKQKTAKLREKTEDQSWSAALKRLFSFVAWIERTRVYRIFRIIPYPLLNGLGHMIGFLILGTSTKVQNRIAYSMQYLHPNQKPSQIKRISIANAKYLGMLVFDLIFRLPLTSDLHYSEFFSYEHLEYLDRALEKGKGVIIPTLHLGQYFHPAISLYNHSNRYPVSIIAKIENLPLYENINRKKYNHVCMIAATKYENIEPFLQQQMAKNRILVTYHDYSNRTQLRVPLWHGHFPYLVHTPQSYIALHRQTKAEILPAVAIPDGVFGKSRIIFLDNKEIRETSAKYWNAPAKIFHGKLSTILNRHLYPFIVKYAYVWEEIMRLGSRRMADALEIPTQIEISKFLTLIMNKMVSIIDLSYEPNRPDDTILKIIKNAQTDLLKALPEPEKLIRLKEEQIDLTGLNAIQAIQKLIHFMYVHISGLKYAQFTHLLQNLRLQLQKFD